MKVGATGTRMGANDLQKDNLAWYLKHFDITFACHGVCKGGDEDFHNVIRTLNPNILIRGRPGPMSPSRSSVTVDEMFPEEPFLVRDRKVVDDVDLMCALPRTVEETSGGTWYTINYAKKVKKPLIIFWPVPPMTDMFDRPVYWSFFNMENLRESY